MLGLHYHMTVIIVLAFIVGSIVAHPQCLDFRAPFQPASNLTFCGQYSELGCCGESGDETLQEEYEYIQSQVTAKDWDRCNGYVKQLLCQKCSPFAAHIYDAESTGNPRAFPGLCRDYCNAFHDSCHQLVWFFDAPLAATTILRSRQKFCDKVALTDEDYCYPDLLRNSNLNYVINSTATQSSTPGCLCVEKVAQRLANPLFARHAGDGSGRVFVAEQVGRVHIYEPREKFWREELFLDFTDKASVSGFPGDERGFLGMAFHPNFSTNGRFFVFYSTTKKDGDVLPPELKSLPYLFRSKTVISEMKVSSTDPNKADPSSEKVLLELFQPFANHNGGELFFGTDGYLYTFHGDGGGGGDPLSAGQNKSLLLGKVLRLDVDSDPSKPYTIPPDNPFIGEEGTRPEIYAYGVRNIWRCGQDRGDRVTGEDKGRVLCGDVGQSSYEEIDVLKKGVNYGWNSREGFECFDEELCGNIGEEELPIAVYPHSVGKSVTGGVFYRGCESPGLNGQYIFGDYESRQLFSLTSHSNGTWTNKNVYLCGPDLCQGYLERDVGGRILSFGEDEEGEIYVLTSPRAKSSQRNGFMFKIVEPTQRVDPKLCAHDMGKSSRIPLPTRRTIIETGVNEPRKRPNVEIIVRVGGKRIMSRHKKKRLSKKKKRRPKKRHRCKNLGKVEKKRCRKLKRQYFSRKRKERRRRKKKKRRIRHKNLYKRGN